jgi:lysozyme
MVAIRVLNYHKRDQRRKSMNVSQNAIELIAGFEGLRLDAYVDPVGIPTIGYGTIRYPNGTKVRMGDRITEDEAEEFLMHEATKFARDINEVVEGIALNQNQFDALVSFTYNVGPGALRSSTLLKKLKQGKFEALSAASRRCYPA